MTPSRAFLNAIAAAIAADTAFLAQPTTFVEVALVASAFTPSPDLDLGTLTLATRTGLEPIHAASAATIVAVDTQTGDTIIEVREPAGGWRWITSDDTEGAETIYGYVLLSSDGNDLIASAVLDTPVLFHALTENEMLELPNVRFRFNAAVLS